MSKKKTSRIWAIAMPLSVVFLAAVYYTRVPEFRKFVDDKTPLANQLLGKWVKDTSTKVIELKGEQDAMFAKATPPRGTPPLRALATPAPNLANVPAPATPAPPPPVATPPPISALDLQKLASDRTKWPKTVALTKPVMFPAVLNGKEVGKLLVPAGSEANLRQIKDDKLGLEFNGGGAWVPAAETDLVARVQR